VSPSFEIETSDNADLLPLVVDLDYTLLLTDTLWETFAVAVFKRPLSTAPGFFQLRKGRAAFKHALSADGILDVHSLPSNESFVEYLRKERSAGRELHLVSAANQNVVNAVADRFGFFESATGSDGVRNLKGQVKAAYLRERFPHGFAYAGDSHVDLAVWKEASAAVLVGATAVVSRKAEKYTKIEARFDRMSASAKDWRKLFRLHQWSKNALIFIALFLGHAYNDLSAWLSVIGGFLFFSIAASGTYVLNDLTDLSSDRRHGTKRQRPMASGRIPIRSGIMAAVGMLGVGLSGMLALDLTAFLLTAAYLAITLSYSFRFKAAAMLDVLILASLYTIRIILGAELANVALSDWLLVFSMFFFLSLSMAKRYVEVAKAGSEIKIRGRGYSGADAVLLLNFGIATCSCAVFTVCMYLLEAAFPSNAYSTPQLLWIAVLSIALWSMRIWLLAFRGDLDDDPVAFAVKDRKSLLLGGIAAIGVGGAILI
jgi:4-hydroxybenzoate polyprenyltransferase/phosphoserine phosphatase